MPHSHAEISGKGERSNGSALDDATGDTRPSVKVEVCGIAGGVGPHSALVGKRLTRSVESCIGIGAVAKEIAHIGSPGVFLRAKQLYTTHMAGRAERQPQLVGIAGKSCLRALDSGI